MSREPSPAHAQSASRLLTRKSLQPADVVAIRDLNRFGVMADYQLVRRYGDTALADARLTVLKTGGVVFVHKDEYGGARLYLPTRLARLLVKVPGVEKRKTPNGHLAHDIALVDLADFLTHADPTAEWRTEREVRPFLAQIAPPPRLAAHVFPHRPDGVLVAHGQRIGIELEHSNKSEERYRRISRWFACEWRLDRVRWYVDKPAIVDRLRRANAQSGFDRDLQIDIEEFPPGVVFRTRSGSAST